ncbi:MAG: 1,4-alpha-glucan branching enzyme [Clostridiales bacterium GWF2_38_85]|nr:MAG: 1,4-alpha-glucan branching enzyme [Clostridiales bacterium GWF2_38_85]
MGAHKCNNSEYLFRVWAPNATEVFLTGDFNNWSNSLIMTKETESGIWYIILSNFEFGEGSLYKYIIKSENKYVYKSDPYAFMSETAGKTASIINDLSGFEWSDSKYLKRRKSLSEYLSQHISIPKPMNIYEVHLGSWQRNNVGSNLTYRQLADRLCPYILEMGYTHIELLPVAEHPYDGSWGYQVCSYYASTSRFGKPQDFMYFINKMHSVGIGVILDWVPAHFPKDEHGLYEFDGTPLYEYQGQDRMEHKGWGTRFFDVGRNEVQSFLISNALFWMEKYHIDGIRVDAVASMLYLDYDRMPGEWNPNPDGTNINQQAVAFFRKLNEAVSTNYPDVIMIAEESTDWSSITKPIKDGGLGFHYKWDMGWMNDTLSYISEEFTNRKYNHNKLTFSMVYSFNENYILPISHDEVVHGKKSLIDKMNGDYWQKFATMRAFLGYMMTHPGKKLLFMGSEYGQFREWDYSNSLEWFMLDFEMHKKLLNYTKDLNRLYLKHNQFWECDSSWNGFKWLIVNDSKHSVIAYERLDKKKLPAIVIINFTPNVSENFILPVDINGAYIEIFNSDDVKYGGSGVINPGILISNKVDSEYKIHLRLPPLGISILMLK